MKRKRLKQIKTAHRFFTGRLAVALLAVLFGLGALAATGCATGGEAPSAEVMGEISDRPVSYQQGYQNGWMDASEDEHLRRNLERMTVDILYAQGYDDGWWDYKDAHRSLPGRMLKKISR